MDNLLKRGWSGNNRCVMCGVDLESVDQLLVRCIVSKFLFSSHLDEFHSLPSTEDVNTVWEGLLGRGSQTEAVKAQTLVAATWWTIWRDINNVIFRNLSTNAISSAHRIGALAKEWDDFCRAG